MNSPAHRYRIGIDLGGTKIEAIALTPDGNEILRQRVPTPKEDYRGTVAAIAGLIGKVEGELGEKATVGIGMPGAISPATGLVMKELLLGQNLTVPLEAFRLDRAAFRS